jgi:hypothetical protein
MVKVSLPLKTKTLPLHLYRLLSHPEVKLEYGPLTHHVAQAIWEEAFPPTNIRLKIDANQDKHISSVVHELLHIVFCGMVTGYLDSDLEEICIIALEKHVYDYITASPQRESRWNRLIEAKLNQFQPPEAPLALKN